MYVNLRTRAVGGFNPPGSDSGGAGLREHKPRPHSLHVGGAYAHISTNDE